MSYGLSKALPVVEQVAVKPLLKLYDVRRAQAASRAEGFSHSSVKPKATPVEFGDGGTLAIERSQASHRALKVGDAQTPGYFSFSEISARERIGVKQQHIK